MEGAADKGLFQACVCTKSRRPLLSEGCFARKPNGWDLTNKEVAAKAGNCLSKFGRACQELRDEVDSAPPV